MSTILFCPVTFNLAEVTRMIEVARALDPRHRLVFQGYESDFAHLIEDAGFDYRPAEPALTAEGRRQALRFDQGRTLRSPFTDELVAARVDAERRLIREVGADAVVIGTNATSMISARAEGVPLFYPVPFALTRPHVEQARRIGLVRGTSAPARAADAVATRVLRGAYTRAPLAPRAFARVAVANGVPPLRTIASLLEADHNLLTVMPRELEGFTLPAGYTRVGPIFARLDGELPPVVAELAADDRPLVYLGLGSSAQRDLALAIVSVLGGLPVNVIAPIAHYLGTTGGLPPNVHVTGLLPAHRLGRLVDAAVLHGGQGTVQTACAAGIPFVGVGLQPEQVWNVDQCVARGHAIAVSPRRAGTRDLADAVHRLLAEEDMRTTAARVAEEFHQEDGAAATARHIERELTPPDRRGRPWTGQAAP